MKLGMRVVLVAGLAVPNLAFTGPISPHTEEAIARGLNYKVQPYGLGQAKGFGVAIVDLNGNGHNDIIVLGATDGLVGFFENDGTGHFIDRSFTSGRFPTAKVKLNRASGIAVADYNGDGLLDVYLTQEMNQQTDALFPNVLLRNNGDFTFTDVTAATGVGTIGNSQGAAWGDFDHDGWLDLYVANYTFDPPDPTHWNKFYHNPGAGGGLFAEISNVHDMENKGQGFTPVFSDVNRNGWLDVYFANDRGHTGPAMPANQLWINNEGQYERICPEGTHWPDCESCSTACIGLWSMCVAAGDFTGNGYPDFYVTNIFHFQGYNGKNPLLINHGDSENGAPTFTEECSEAGVCSFATSWCGIFYDFSNNGWLDLYVCNQGTPSVNVPNRLYANTGTWPVANVAAAANVTAATGMSYNAAVGDVTGNGALDLLINNYGLFGGAAANVQLFINHEGLKRNWIRYSVVGYDGNVHAIGANIEVTANGLVQWREIYAGGNNYKAQNELVWHFGLGEATEAEVITVNWPALRGSRTLTNYPANQRWTIWPEFMLGDSNDDGEINGFDLLALLGAWGTITPGNERMDMNGDGVINGFDLLALLGMWGPISPEAEPTSTDDIDIDDLDLLINDIEQLNEDGVFDDLLDVIENPAGDGASELRELLEHENGVELLEFLLNWDQS